MARSTRQRHLITGILDRADRPLSMGEVLARGRAELPGLGQATVYRALRDLQEAGEVHAVEIPGAPTTYERSQHRHDHGHHHHFHCRECSRVFEVPGCPAGIAALTPPGFRLDDHELTLYGRCPECIAESPLP